MTGTKHMVTIVENDDFSAFIKAYEDWSGNKVTDKQRATIFRIVVEEGAEDRLLALIAGTAKKDSSLQFTAGMEWLTGEGDGKNLDPKFY